MLENPVLLRLTASTHRSYFCSRHDVELQTTRGINSARRIPAPRKVPVRSHRWTLAKRPQDNEPEIIVKRIACKRGTCYEKL